MNPVEQNALQNHIEKLEKQLAEMRKLSTRKGFYEQFFKELITAKTNIEAFNTINERYHVLFGNYRYSDFNSFKVMSNYYNKKK